MVEGEQKLCLAEPTLELVEKVLLQVPVQLMEEMEALEALEAEEEWEEEVETAIRLPFQRQMEVSVEQEVMVEAAEEVEAEATPIQRVMA